MPRRQNPKTAARSARAEAKRAAAWFRKYESWRNQFFQPALPGYSLAGQWSGCGPTCLALLTGWHPNHFTSKHPVIRQKGHTSAAMMLRLLREKDIQSWKVDLKDVLNRDANRLFPLGAGHVLLILRAMARNENSWWVFSGQHTYHNGTIDSPAPLDELNMPMISAWLLRSKKWRYKGWREPKANRQPIPL